MEEGRDALTPLVGLVYVMVNASMPNLVKVGYTTMSAEQRARALRTTGVPSEFLVVWDEAVSDPRAVERLAHKELSPWRHRHDREFFAVPAKQAIRVVMEAARRYRVAVPSARSRNLVPDLAARFGSRLGPWVVDAWVGVERGAVIFGWKGGAAVSLLTRLGQLAFEGQPALSPIDPPDVSADVLLAAPEAVLAMILGDVLVDR